MNRMTLREIRDASPQQRAITRWLVSSTPVENKDYHSPVYLVKRTTWGEEMPKGYRSYTVYGGRLAGKSARYTN